MTRPLNCFTYIPLVAMIWYIDITCFCKRNAKETSSIVVKKIWKVWLNNKTKRQKSIQLGMIYFPFHVNAFAMNYVAKDSFASQDSVTTQGLVRLEAALFYVTQTSSRSGDTQQDLYCVQGTRHSWQDTSAQKKLKILISDLEGSKCFF